jgi:WD40 repeat protein
VAAGGRSARAVAAAQETVATMALAKGKAVLGVLALALLGSAASVLALAQRHGPPPQGPPAPVAAALAEQGSDVRGNRALPAGATARLGTAPWHQEGEVFFVAFDRGDNQLITARQGGTGRSKNENRCNLCHRHPFEPTLASREAVEGMVRVWDLRAARVRRQLGKLPAQRRLGELIGERGVIRVERNASERPTVCVASSPAGDLLAETGPSGPLVLWELTTGRRKELAKADPHAGLVGLAFRPDGKLLATLGAGGRVRLYDVGTGKETAGGVAADPKQETGWGDAVVFAPSGRFLAISGAAHEGEVVTGVLGIWQHDTGTRTLRLRGRARGSPAFGFSPDGRTLAWSAEDGRLRLTDVVTGKDIRTLGQPQQTRYLAALAFSPDGKRLATLGYDRAARLWHVATGRQERQLHRAETGLQRGRRVRFEPAGAAPGANLAFAHDGKLLAVGGSDGRVYLWDVATGKEVNPVHEGAVTGVVFAADGKVLLSLGEDGTARQWDLHTGAQRRSTLLPAEARAGVLAPDGRTVVYHTFQRALAVWDLATGSARLRVADLESNAGRCPGCEPAGDQRLSADGKLLARLGVEGTVGVWDVPSGRKLWALYDGTRPGGVPATRDARHYLAFTAKGKRLAALTTGRSPADPAAASFLLWDLGSGKLVRRLDGLPSPRRPAQLAPDGRTLAMAAQDGRVALWEIATGKKRLDLRTGVPGSLTALACSPGGTLLVAAGPERTLWCWDTVTGELVGQRRGDQNEVGVLAFSPNGRQFVSGGRDGTVLVWDVAGFQQKGRRRAPRLEEAEQRQCWADLASTDAGRAARALARLRSAPSQAVALLRRQVRPAVGPPAEKVDGWIKDLGSEAFSRRTRASAELAKLGGLAEPALRKALANRPYLEARRRIEKLLNDIQSEAPTSAERLRDLRAVELLERLPEPEAERLLQDLAAGAAGARLTREAQAAVGRRRNGSKH